MRNWPKQCLHSSVVAVRTPLFSLGISLERIIAVLYEIHLDYLIVLYFCAQCFNNYWNKRIKKNYIN